MTPIDAKKAGEPSSPDLPSRRTLLVEILAYTALVLAAGFLFVAFRVRREGTRILDPDPRAPSEERAGRATPSGLDVR